MSTDYHILVREFHYASGLPVRDVPTWATRGEYNMRVDITYEEFRELQDAISIRSMIGTADALADLSYVICGNLATFGLMPVYIGELRVEPYKPALRWPDKDRVCELRSRLYDTFMDYARTFSKSFFAHAQTASELLFDLQRAAMQLGIPLDEVFEEVHASNMTKLVGGVHRRDDGKILKGVNFRKPDVEGILARHLGEALADALS